MNDGPTEEWENKTGQEWVKSALGPVFPVFGPFFPSFTSGAKIHFSAFFSPFRAGGPKRICTRQSPVLPRFLEEARKTHQKKRNFYPYQNLKITGKEGKKRSKNKEILASRETKESQTKKERGKEGQGPDRDAKMQIILFLWFLWTLKRNLPKKIHPEQKSSSERVFLNNFRWVPDSCHREAGESSRELFKKVRVDSVFLWHFGIWGGVFGPLWTESGMFCKP